MKSLKLAITLLMLLPLVSFAEDGKAKIVTGTVRAAQCISSVHINNIDGREVYVQALGFDIDAGEHVMTGRAIIDTTFCKAVRSGSQRYKVQPLEANFEAGKTYYVGYDHSSSYAKEWKLVIWKVEGGDS